MTTAAAHSPTAFTTEQRPWWLTLIGGIMALAVGAVLLWAPAKTQVETWVLLVELLGLYWLVTGILDLVHMFMDHQGWAWKLIMGIVSILAGGYILIYPRASAMALPRIFVLILGLWGLIHGIGLLVMAFKGGGLSFGVLGVLSLLFGLFLVMNYQVQGMGLSIIWLAAITGVVGGLVMIWHAIKQRSATA